MTGELRGQAAIDRVDLSAGKEIRYLQPKELTMTAKRRRVYKYFCACGKLIDRKPRIAIKRLLL